MIKAKFTLSTISKGLELLSVNNTSINENCELSVFENIEFIGEIFNNCPNDLFGISIYKTLELCL